MLRFLLTNLLLLSAAAATTHTANSTTLTLTERSRSLHEENCEIQNLSIDSNSPRCLRCAIGYLLIENICELKSKPAHQNCIEFSRFDDCMRCDCGYSLNQQLNICVETPTKLSGCQVILSSFESVCLRPKSEFEIYQTKSGTIIGIGFSKSSNCEIRLFPTGECFQCHSGFKLDSNKYACLKAQERIENVYYSYFDFQGILQSRDTRFTALHPTGVYRVIYECSKHAFNHSLNRLECVECNAGKIRNVSGSVCVKSPFESCAMVDDIRYSECFQCFDSHLFYVFKNKVCRLRTNTLMPKCMEFADYSDECLACYAPFVLIQRECISLHNVESTVLALKNSIKMENCVYAITEKQCLECDQNYILSTVGTCLKLLPEIALNCIEVNLEGITCSKCHHGYIITTTQIDSQENKSITICSEIETWNCIWPRYFGEKGCYKCKTGYSLNSENNCVISDANCVETDGRTSTCEMCKNLFYTKIDYRSKTSSICLPITSVDYCIYSDGIRDRCLACHRSFGLTSSGTCISRIKHDDAECEFHFSYLPSLQQFNNTSTNINKNNYLDSKITEFQRTDSFCIPHQFAGIQKCVAFDPNQNRCLRCFRSYFLTPNGHCEHMEHCSESNGVDKICYYTSDFGGFIQENGWEVGFIKPACETNGRDALCIICESVAGTGELGLISIDDGTCIESSRIDVLVRSNCINVKSMMKKNNHQQYVCALCKNLFYPSSVNGTCQEIDDFKKCSISNGTTNECIYCAAYFIGGNSFEYILHRSSHRCIKAHELLDQMSNESNLREVRYARIRYCQLMRGEECLKCKNLYALKLIDRITVCAPVKSSECRTTDGISEVCLECRDPYSKIGPHGDCVNAYCSSIDPVTLHCKSCVNGYELKEYNNSIPKCVPNFLKTCRSRNEFGKCQECSRGYFILPQRIGDPHCYRIWEPNCLEVRADSTECSLCDVGYFLSPHTKVCLPINRRCEVSSANRFCLKCETSFLLSEKHNTCEVAQNCVKFSETHCIQCASSYYLSDTKLECFKITNCKYSLGIFNVCLRCEENYLLMNFECFLPYSIDHCVQYAESLNACLKCASLYQITQGNHLREQIINQCIPITISSCQLSNGYDNECVTCEYTGYILSEDKKTCLRIQNCILSDGISACLKCRDGFFYSLNPARESESNTSRKQLSCRQQKSLISNCVKYDFYVARKCVECENLFYLSTDSLTCYPLSQSIRKNCILSDGINASCQHCLVKFIRKQSESKECKPYQMNPIRNCMILSYMSNDCHKCYPMYFLTQEKLSLDGISSTTKTRTCQLRSNSSDSSCALHHPEKDECLICHHGYLLDEELRSCQPIPAQQSVDNCIRYQENSNICIECISPLLKFKNNILNDQESLDVIHFILDKSKNVCLNVYQLMCREFEGDSLKCLKPFIRRCIRYNHRENNSENNLSSSCLECDQGFYVRNDGICVEHTRIPLCIAYHKHTPNECIACELHYRVTSNKQSCVFHKIDHCLAYSEDQYHCKQCKQMYSIDANTGTCVRTEFENCIRIDDIRKKRLTCQECITNYFPQPYFMKCDLIPQKDPNCYSFPEQVVKPLCNKCETGYFLNEQSDCLSRSQSPCSISNCFEYDFKSNPDSYSCRVCATGFHLDSKSKSTCSRDSTKQSQTEITNDVNDASKKQKQGGDNLEDSSKVVWVLSIVLVILVFAGLAYFVLFDKCENSADEETAHYHQHQDKPIQSSLEMPDNISDSRQQ